MWGRGGGGLKYSEFMGNLRRGLRHVYLLAGAEHYYIDRAREAILERLFPDGVRADEIQKVGDLPPAQLAGLIETVPFFTDKNVILVQESSLFRASKGTAEEKKDSEEPAAKKGRRRKKSPEAAALERLTGLLQEMPADSYVIFVSKEKPDKRKKLVKLIEKVGAVLEAEPLRPWQVGDWLEERFRALGKSFDREAYEYFMSAVSMMQEVSLSYLDQELTKLALVVRGRRISRQDLLSVFAGLPEVSVFALADAVSEQNAGRALALLRRELADGTYFTVILSLLARHVRQLFEARLLMAEGVRGRALAKPLELNPFIAEKLGRAAQKFTDAQLRQALLELADADYLLKTGQGGNELLEEIVIGLCQRRGRGYSAGGR